MAGQSNLPPDVIALLMKEIAELKAFVEKMRVRSKPVQPKTGRAKMEKPLRKTQEPHDEPHDK
ncbi:MAG: hypothetical protein PW791_07965 [Neorhizobium sp.]|jgi:hypothetical protein|nr:hypothetical protein [Neorhizobium sp.]